MKKKFLLLTLLCNMEKIESNVLSVWKKTGKTISNQFSKLENTIVNNVHKVESGLHNIKEKVSEKSNELYYENHIMKLPNGKTYLPFKLEDILYFLKKNDFNSSLFKDPNLLKNILNQMNELLPYMPLPDFDTAIHKENNKALYFIKPFFKDNINIYYDISILTVSIFLFFLIYSTKTNWHKHSNENSLIHNNIVLLSINILCTLLLFILFPPSDLENLYTKKLLFITALFLLITPLIYNIYKNYHEFEINKNWDIFTTNPSLQVRNMASLTFNILFIVTFILYVQSFKWEYNNLQNKLNSLGLIPSNNNSYYMIETKKIPELSEFINI